MIKDAMTFIRTTLDQHLRLKFQLTETAAINSRLVDSNGNMPPQNQNKMVITLINVEQETSRQFTGRYSQVGADKVQNVSPSERFNLDLMFVASFDDYEESLAHLESTIALFQAYPALDSSVSSNIPKGIEKISLDIDTLNYTQTYNLWSALGAKYLPSVVYKARLVTIQSDDLIDLGQAIQRVDQTVNPNANG